MRKLIAIIMVLSTWLGFSGEFSKIELKDFKGKKFTLKKYEGKKTYIKLWASWCPACLYSLPEYAKLKKEVKDFNVINVVFPDLKGEQDEEDFKEWFNKTEFAKQFDVFFDGKGQIFEKIKLRGFPYNVFLDSKGNLATSKIGVLNIEQIKNIMKDIK